MLTLLSYSAVKEQKYVSILSHIFFWYLKIYVCRELAKHDNIDVFLSVGWKVSVYGIYEMKTSDVSVVQKCIGCFFFLFLFFLNNNKKEVIWLESCLTCLHASWMIWGCHASPLGFSELPKVRQAPGCTALGALPPVHSVSPGDLR